MKTPERIRLPADHEFLDVLAPDAHQQFTTRGRTLASYDVSDIDDFLRRHPDLAIGSERFTITTGSGMFLYCLRSWDFTAEHNWAIKLLKEKGHAVGNYHPSDGLINVDGQFIDFTSMYRLVSNRYPREWSEYQNKYEKYLRDNATRFTTVVYVSRRLSHEEIEELYEAERRLVNLPKL